MQERAVSNFVPLEESQIGENLSSSAHQDELTSLLSEGYSAYLQAEDVENVTPQPDFHSNHSSEL